MDFKEIILTELKEIYNSPRWNNPNNPCRTRIPELSERINDAQKYTELRENQNLELLRETVEALEESFNDEWLPFEFFGLELNDVRIFIKDVIETLPNCDEVNITETMIQCHNYRMKTK